RNEPKQGRALGEKPRVGERLLRGALEPVLGGDRCELDARTSILQGETVKDRVRREREPAGDEERQGEVEDRQPGSERNVPHGPRPAAPALCFGPAEDEPVRESVG